MLSTNKENYIEKNDNITIYFDNSLFLTRNNLMVSKEIVNEKFTAVISLSPVMVDSVDYESLANSLKDFRYIDHNLVL